MSRIQAVILGSTGGRRRLDSARSVPVALTEAGGDQPVLSWIQRALAAHGVDDLTYVGGYHIEKVIEFSPGLNYVYHQDWRREGDLGALQLLEPRPDEDYLFIRSDLVVTAEAIRALLDVPEDLVFGMAAGEGGRERPGAVLVRARHVSEFMAAVAATRVQDARAGLGAVAATLEDAGRVNLLGLASFLDNRVELTRLVFQGKARTLEQLDGLTTQATVLGQVRFAVTDWQSDAAPVLKAIAARLDANRLVVRSSSATEDRGEQTGAGQFESVLDVDAGDPDAIAAAVERVIESYRRDGRHPHPDDEVLVQPQVTDVVSSGVMFTRDIDTRAPYLTITIDRESLRPDVVTSGSEGQVDTYHLAWNTATDDLPEDVARLNDLATELIGLTHLDALDIEFCFDSAGRLFLFQVRPLPGAEDAFELSDQDLLDALQQACSFVAESAGPHPVLSGATTVFGNMPDWNPAEMIGKAPRPLALSLYQALIGDFHWARARADIGYRDVTPEPLVVSIAGRPYIDVRASLNSFLPSELPEAIAAPWLDHCLARLASFPELHDKLEFEILPTCLAFDWDEHAPRMRDAGLSADDIATYRDKLARLTSAMITGQAPAMEDLLRDVGHLEAMRGRRLAESATSAPGWAGRARLLLVDCGRYGITPFSILARYAFVALALLKSMVRAGLLSADDMERFLQSVPTVAGEFTADLARLRSGEMDKAAFLARYGHLRPNSYEITSANYTQAFDQYLAGSGDMPGGHAGGPPGFDAWLETNAGRVDPALAELGLACDARTLFTFMRGAIAGREKAKFEFMKSVDSTLDAITRFGDLVGLSTEELAHLHVDEILQFARSSMNGSTPAHLRRMSTYKMKQMEITRAIKLPDLLTGPADLGFHRQEHWRPNFVTRHNLRAEAVDLDGVQGQPDLAGKIVLIQAADPGYDWIFGHGIAGLVTEYGGIGSHMAIRAAEFSLPAAIGCGSVIFEQLRKARVVELDCANETVKRIE